MLITMATHVMTKRMEAPCTIIISITAIAGTMNTGMIMILTVCENYRS